MIAAEIPLVSLMPTPSKTGCAVGVRMTLLMLPYPLVLSPVGAAGVVLMAVPSGSEVATVGYVAFAIVETLEEGMPVVGKPVRPGSTPVLSPASVGVTRALDIMVATVITVTGV